VKFVGEELWVSSTNSHELFKVHPETGVKTRIDVREG
jgi:hypothetical protein